ncbi:MAG: pectin acetylesterase-family hydrolase [Myxococcota bacterium]
MIQRRLLELSVGLLVVSAGCSEDDISDSNLDDGDAVGFTPPSFGQWIKYEPEGATCSDGSQWAFYVEFSEASDNVVIYFMGGGGCWDYESCVGGSARGATNLNRPLPDDYANEHTSFNLGGIELAISVNQIYPLLNRDPSVTPMADWNKVFVPYCTGDTYAGAITTTYDDPSGTNPSAEFEHQGHTNVLAMTSMLNGMFATVPKLFVGGCSAGGVGAMTNYYFLRSGIRGVERGYLLNDSGPLFPSQAATSRSLPLQNRVRASWDIDSVIGTIPQTERLAMDFGELSRVLTEEFPNDRLASTMFRLDYNYSLYSYERFWTRDGADTTQFTGTGLGLNEDVAEDRTAIYSLWWDDISLLRAQYDAPGGDNLAYFVPFYRNTNNSHCVSVPGAEDVPPEDLAGLFLNDVATLSWAGSEIEADGINFRGFVDHLLSDDPLQSYFESDGEGRFLACTPNADDYDAVACQNAVDSP